MSSRILRRGLAAAAVGASFLFVPPAEAQSSRDKVISTLVEALKAAGAKDVKYGSVAGDDAKFTVKEIEADLEVEGKSSTLTADSATYTGATTTPDGGYKADGIEMSDLSLSDDDVEISIDSWKIAGYVGQSPAKIKETQTFGDRFDSMDLTGITIEAQGEKPVPIYSIAVRASDYADGIPRKASLALRGLVVPIDPNNPSSKDVADLGYKEVALDVDFAGGWDEKAQRLSVDTVSVNGKDMGALKISFAFGNVTAEAMKGLQTAAADPNKQMEILQGFSVEQISLRFENASLVDRIIDAQAKRQGAKRDQYVTGIAAAVPLMIAAIGNPEFEKKVADAVGAFLKAPKSLTVVAKPAQPVPVAQLVGTVMVAPQTIPTVLAVDIQANK